MKQFRSSPAVLSITLLSGLACAAAGASAQEADTLAAIQLTFPLKATVPDQDQHLTSATAPVNSVFDHSMLDATTHYVIYGCDKTVVAFNGTTASFGPGYPILGVGCNAGYKVQNVTESATNFSGARHELFGMGLAGISFLRRPSRN